MRLLKLFKYALATAGLLVLAWTLLTLFVQKKGPSKSWHFFNAGSKKALIVFDPDLFLRRHWINIAHPNHLDQLEKSAFERFRSYEFKRSF
jgi:hypothetical protein